MTIENSHHFGGRRLFGALLAGVAIGSGLFTGTIVGQSGPQATTEEFQQVVLPVLSKSCLSCHSDRLQTGNLSLEPFRDATLAAHNPQLWQKVLDKVTSGQMPPRPSAPLSESELAAVAAWIRKLPGVSEVSTNASAANPGRVTARRLNRAEYNNTVRDLLGVTLRPADEFPMDDSGYGFDNIGDVLSLSPMLMEKYLNAARSVAGAAVFGESYPDKPAVLTKWVPKKVQDNMQLTGGVTPYSLRGAFYATYHAPVDGEYEFRWHYGNYRGRGKPVGAGRPYSTAIAPAPVAVTSADELKKTVADGVYMEVQATRGAASYDASCSRCHLADLGGANGPALRGERFARSFANKDLKTLYTKIATTMPRGTAGSLGDAVYLDIVAHVLRENGFPAGDAELTAGDLSTVRVLPGKPDQPQATAAGRGRGAAPAQPRAVLTEEEQKARLEKSRTAFPAIKMTFSVDGVPVYNTMVEGDGGYNYARGEDVSRVKLTAGDHAVRIAWPDLANLDNPFRQINADGRQELFVEYVRVLGPFAPSKASPESFKKIFICGQPGNYTPACVRQIVTNLVTRAYRRPATPAEVQTLLTLVTQIQKRDSVEHGIRMAIEAVLVSPNFLFRIERDQPVIDNDSTTASSYQISDHELASRLSYFLWTSMPDDELFRLAEQKRLHDPAVLSAQVKRLLQDPRSSALVDNFGEQWLNLRLMDRTKPDADKFLVVDDELLDAMRQETRQFIAAIFRENRSILDFIDGRFTFVNGPLARYYGIKGVDGEEFQRVELDGEQRSGLVTQGAILTISSYATRTSPVLRGKWVLDNLLGAPPAPAPDNIPPLEEKDLGTAASMRERLQEHRANPRCSVCHDQMDPIGFSLENYDAAGAWRVKDGNFDLDTTGTLPDGRSFTGAKGLKQILRADSPVFTKNFTEKLLTYGLGRGLERTDRPVVEHISREVARDDYRFLPLVTAIVNSQPFRMRTRAGGL